MTKRLIDIDDDLVESARQELGTPGIADTVRSARHFAAARSARLSHIDRLRSGGMAALAEKEARTC